MAHLLKMSLTKELFGTGKYRAVNWVTQITASSAHVTIRIIYLKKSYSNLKFSFNNSLNHVLCHGTVELYLRSLILKISILSEA